jgi:hypothetical protein
MVFLIMFGVKGKCVWVSNHVDHHEAKRTAKPMPIATAARMSRIVSFMGLLLKG